MQKKRNMRLFVISAIAVIFAFWGISPVSASIADDIAEKNRQIVELQKQIDAYQKEIETNKSKARTLQNEIDRFNAKINQIALEIRSLGFSIDQTGLEIRDTEGKIEDALARIDRHKVALAQYLRVAYEVDQKTLTEILLNNDTLSDFFNELNSLQATQDNLRINIENIRTLKDDLEVRKEDLEGKKGELERLKSLQEIEKRSLDGNKQVKNKLLKDTKGQETKFQELVKQSKLTIARLQDQIFYLQQNGVSVEDAVKFGNLAAISAGIRPAFLIAILEIESGLGRNVGTGNWLDDMYNCYLRLGKKSRAEAEKAAFFEIVGKLGLDPAAVKVSREPNYGCGGALGPAQFIATTWLAYEDDVIRLTGHNPPSPWNIEDAFTAAAVKLARGGATSKNVTGETRAAKAYIGGSPTCSAKICNYYASAVLRKASEIEQDL